MVLVGIVFLAEIETGLFKSTVVSKFAGVACACMVLVGVLVLPMGSVDFPNRFKVCK